MSAIKISDDYTGYPISDDYIGYPVSNFCVPKHYEDDIQSVMIPAGLIDDRIERIATDIFRETKDEPLTVLCVLKGGYRFFTDLLDKLTAFNRTHGSVSVPIRIDFIRLKSYENDKSSGKVSVIGGDNLDRLKGQSVLVVEDIVDTGKTIECLVNLLKEKEPKSVKVASLLVKRRNGKVAMTPDYCGFEIPDKFVIGYALDYNEYFRDLNHICVINENGKKKYMNHH